MIDYNWFDHLLGFILIVGIPAASIRSGSINDDEVKLDLPPKKHLYYTNGLVLIIAASIILTVWNITKRPWSSLGINWITSSRVAFLALGSVVIIYLIDLYWSISKSKQDDSEGGMKDVIPLTTNDFSHYIFLAVAAGICEEIMYRGFLIPYVEHWFLGLEFAGWVGISLPAISFGLSHLYQGWAAVLKIVVIGILLGIVFYYSESLIIVVLLHIIIDLVSGYVGMRTLSKSSVQNDTDLES